MKYLDARDLVAAIAWLWNDKTHELEEAFARYIGARHAVCTSYGRSALYLGLRAIGVAGSEVIVPAFICTVVRHAVTMAGAVPKFVDIDPETFVYDLKDLKQKLSRKTKVLLLVHFFGRVALNMEEVVEIARRNDIIVIEDCAHSLGAEYGGIKLGNFGDCAIFSLTKNLINCGGGFLITKDERIYSEAKDILLQGRKSLMSRFADFPLVVSYGLEQGIQRVVFDRVGEKKAWLAKVPNAVTEARRVVLGLWTRFSIGRNGQRLPGGATVTLEGLRAISRYDHQLEMEPIIASLGLAQLKKIDLLTEKRQGIYDRLRVSRHIHFKQGIAGAKDVYTYVVLRYPGRDIAEVVEQSRKQGLVLRTTWPRRQKLWKGQETLNVMRIKDEVVTWNVNPDLTEKEIERFLQIADNGN